MKLNAWQRAWIVASVIWVPIAIGFGIEQGYRGVPYAGPAVLRALAKDCTATLQRLSDEEKRAIEEADYRDRGKMFEKFTKEKYLALWGPIKCPIQTDEDCRKLEGWGYSMTTLEAYHAARADVVRHIVIVSIALIIIPVIGVYVLVWLGYHTVRWILKGVW